MKNLFFILFLFSLKINAQILPVGFTPDEKLKLQNGDFSISDSKGMTTIPTGALRTMAEWEEIQTLLVTYGDGSGGFYPSILRQIIDIAQEECKVLVVCSDSNAVKSYLTAGSVPLTNVQYIQTVFNSIWVRDYGGHSVYKNDVDSLILVEWIYNRVSRPNDNVMPDAHGAFTGVPVYSTKLAPNDLVNTGGNWMVDGFGTAFASKLVLNENKAGNPYGVSAKTEAQIDTIMKQYMGINRYIKMDTLPYDLIHHIDMHMKLLNEETLLVGEYPVGVADGPQIETNLNYVTTNFNSVFGTPYKVIRVPQPPSTGGSYPDAGGYYRTYANNVFVNKTLIVPGYRDEYDTIAQRILSDALIGYNIQFIDCDNSGSAIIAASGAIHCITNAIGANNPLLIKHQALIDTYDAINPYHVNAWIKHKAGILNATMYYSTNGGVSYSPVSMTLVSGNDYTADIPAQAAGTEIFYYIEATSVSGKTQVRPIVAPTGYFHFKVLTPIGLYELQNNNINLTIYPNPADELTWLKIDSDFSGNSSLTLFDISGKLIKQIKKGNLTQGQTDVFLDVADLNHGIYLIELTINNESIVKKLVVK